MKKWFGKAFCIGAIIGATASIAYLLWGRWGWVPFLNMSVPSDQWARIIFWPGLTAGRYIFREILANQHNMNYAKYTAAFGGVLVNAVCAGLLAELLKRLRFAK